MRSIIDVSKAFTIVKSDLHGMTFVNYPFEEELVDLDQQLWLDQITEKLQSDSYTPSVCDIAEVPKGKGAVRPGSILTLEDQVVYTTLVDAIYGLLHKELLWSQGSTDYSYRLNTELGSKQWFRDQFNGWKDFKDNSVKRIDEGDAFVVITDITGFYENIDHSLLLSDLRQIHSPDEIVNAIRSCLVKWAQLDTKGIPQGSSASHLLAKLYLNPVDSELKDLGYTHFRYVDDFRIFCSSISEAKRALIDLTAILRKRGLNLQSAKSKIVRADDAKPEIEGTATLIDAVSKKIISQLEFVADYPYSSSIRINTEKPNQKQLVTIVNAFNDFFANADDSSFDKSLFHYLLNKLGQAKDKSAFNYCLEQLERHPEETIDILRYIERANMAKEAEDYLLKYINSDIAVYDYQNYKIIEWFLVNKLHHDQLINFARAVAFDNNKPSYYRAICKKLLGLHGNTADLGRIKTSYNSATTTVESCAILCSLKNMETARRNSFLSSVENTSDFHKRACKLVKQAVR